MRSVDIYKGRVGKKAKNIVFSKAKTSTSTEKNHVAGGTKDAF